MTEIRRTLSMVRFDETRESIHRTHRMPIRRTKRKKTERGPRSTYHAVTKGGRGAHPVRDRKRGYVKTGTRQQKLPPIETERDIRPVGAGMASLTR